MVKLARAIVIVAVTLTAAAAGAEALARLVGGERGIAAGVIAACMVTMLTSRHHGWRRRRRQPEPQRPLPAQPPARADGQSPERIAA